MRVADYVFKFLADRGARHVFMITGGGAMFLNDAVRLEKRLTPVFNQHEQACAIAAEGYVRAGNGIGLVSVTTGPGGTNTLTGVIGQWLDSIPVIYISGQVKFETTIMSCPELGLRQLGDQEINIVDIVKPVTKYAVAITDARELKRELTKAWQMAFSDRPGPVWLDIPINIQSQMIEEQDMYDVMTNTPVINSPSVQDVQRVVEHLKNAKRPVLIAGHGIRLSGAQEKLLLFAESINIPVLTTFNGMDLIPSDHLLYMGRIGTLGNRAGNFVLQSADLILTIGTRNNVRQISYNYENFAKNAKKIVVDIDPPELSKPTLKPDLAICADAGMFLDAVFTEIHSSAYTVPVSWVSWCLERKCRFPITPPLDSHLEGHVDAYRFANILTYETPVDVPIITGNGTACVAMFQSAFIKSGHRIFWNSGCASMGYDLPASIGAATGGKKVICVAGDGSIQMNLAELQTVLNHTLRVKIFILDNNGYTSIRQTQNSFFGTERIGCDSSSGLHLPDMLKIGAAYGYRLETISSESDMRDKIQRVLAGDDPVICLVKLGENEFAPKLSARKLPDGRIASPSLEDLFPFLSSEEVADNMIQP
jgi:acetolactate synthase-1/2/3 large subunit